MEISCLNSTTKFIISLKSVHYENVKRRNVICKCKKCRNVIKWTQVCGLGPSQPSGGKKGKKGRKWRFVCWDFVKICMFVCLYLLAQMYSQVFNMQQVKKKSKVPFDLIVYCVVQQCQKTVPLLFIYEIIHFYSIPMLCMISTPSGNTILHFDMFPHLKLFG